MFFIALLKTEGLEVAPTLTISFLRPATLLLYLVAAWAGRQVLQKRQALLLVFGAAGPAAPAGEGESSAPGMVGKNKYYVDATAISLSGGGGGL